MTGFAHKRLPRLAGLIFDALTEHPYGLTATEIADLVYTDSDGGPDYASNSIRVRICQMNSEFRKHRSGVRIWGRSTSGRGYQIYLVGEPKTGISTTGNRNRAKNSLFGKETTNAQANSK